MTITEYIQQRRMALAEQLLMTTQLEIKEGTLHIADFQAYFKSMLAFTHTILKNNLKIKKKAHITTASINSVT